MLAELVVLWPVEVVPEALIVTEPVTVALFELCEEVVVADCVVVPLELPVVVALTGPTEKVELGETVLVLLPENTIEDERLEEGEPLVVGGAVGPMVGGVKVELPYGAPLVLMLEVVPLEGAEDVEAVEVLLLVVTTLEEREVLLVMGAVGPTVGTLMVLFPYGAPLVDTLDEKPLEVAEVEFAAVVGTLVVLFIGTVVLMFEEPVVIGAVGFRVGPLLVPFP